MFGILFAILCAVMLVRLWRGPRTGPWAHGGCGWHSGRGRDPRTGDRSVRDDTTSSTSGTPMNA